MVRDKACGLAVSVALAIGLAAAPWTIHRATAQTVAEAKVLLASDDRDEVEAGIQTLGLVGTAEAVPPLVARVRQGLPPNLLEAAIITLMALGQPDAGPLLFDLLSHRRPEIRTQVVEALAVLAPAGAADALTTALADEDPKVRDAAAQALGEIGAEEAVPRLFLALDKGNLQASASIGKLMDPSELPRLLEYLGRIPLRSLQPAMTQILTRKDVGDQAKLRFIGQVQELGTAEVRDFLQDVLAAESNKLSPRVTKAIMAAMRGIAR